MQLRARNVPLAGGSRGCQRRSSVRGRRLSPPPEFSSQERRPLGRARALLPQQPLGRTRAPASFPPSTARLAGRAPSPQPPRRAPRAGRPLAGKRALHSRGVVGVGRHAVLFTRLRVHEQVVLAVVPPGCPAARRRAVPPRRVTRLAEAAHGASRCLAGSPPLLRGGWGGRGRAGLQGRRGQTGGRGLLCAHRATRRAASSWRGEPLLERAAQEGASRSSRSAAEKRAALSSSSPGSFLPVHACTQLANSEPTARRRLRGAGERSYYVNR